MGDHFRGNGKVHLHIGGNGALDHLQHIIAHFQDIFQHAHSIGGFGVQVQHQFRNIAGLVADTLHIRYHFQGCTDLAQIRSHRLLAQQQLQAAVFDLVFACVDLAVPRNHAAGQFNIIIAQGSQCAFNGGTGFVTHAGQQGIQLQKLFIIRFTHTRHGIAPPINQNGRKYNLPCACPQGWRTGVPYRPFPPAPPAGRTPSYLKYGRPAACYGSRL